MGCPRGDASSDALTQENMQKKEKQNNWPDFQMKDECYFSHATFENATLHRQYPQIESAAGSYWKYLMLIVQKRNNENK